MKNIDNLFFTVDYSFSSSIGGSDEYRYIKEVKALVNCEEYDSDDNETNQCIGEVNFKVLNLSEAKSDGSNIWEVFDTYEYTLRHGQAFYDFEEVDFNKEFYRHYKDHFFMNENICLIETMSLLPAYRGMGIGFMIFKDVVHNFKGDCSTFILQPYPLQFDITFENEQKKEILELENFEKNEAKAMKKLIAHYKTWGLQKIKGIDDLLFYNAELVNKKFDRAGLK